MGIPVEFNPDLALRTIEHYHRNQRQLEECIPENLEVGETYSFLKKDHRLYYFLEPIPLLQTEGESRLSRPLVAITLLESTHFLLNGKPFTKGKYRVDRIYDVEDPEVHFEGMQPLDFQLK